MSESLVPNAPETICKERAFTLLEVLVALAILSIAGISIFQLFFGEHEGNSDVGGLHKRPRGGVGKLPR